MLVIFSNVINRQSEIKHKLCQRIDCT